MILVDNSWHNLIQPFWQQAPLTTQAVVLFMQQDPTQKPKQDNLRI